MENMDTTLLGTARFPMITTKITANGAPDDALRVRPAEKNHNYTRKNLLAKNVRPIDGCGI